MTTLALPGTGNRQHEQQRTLRTPRRSYELNADFEDHAEHEYMEFVRENPALENEAFNSEFEADYGSFGSTAELFRQIGLDERHHKEESVARSTHARFN